jgi:hypothetical protein
MYEKFHFVGYVNFFYFFKVQNFVQLSEPEFYYINGILIYRIFCKYSLSKEQNKAEQRTEEGGEQGAEK